MNGSCDVAIIGTGLAGVRCALTLHALDPDRRITLIGDEPHDPYERPPLSKSFLSGDRSTADLGLAGCDLASMRRSGIDVVSGVRVTRLLDSGIDLADGRTLSADAVVLATGARPSMIPAQVDPSRLHVLRTLDDAVRLRAALTDGVRLTIVGSGFVGAEVAATAAARGAEVTVLEAEPIPFGRTLGEQVGGWLVERWHEAGVTLRTGSAVHTIEQGVEAPVSITLADGSSVLSDHVLVAIGTVADDALFHEAHPGLGTIGRGIPVDEDGRSQVDGVFAVGDVALVGAGASARRVEHWTDAAAGAIRLARLLARQPLGTRPVPYAWSDQFGLRVQVAGLIAADLEAVVDDASPRSLLVRYLDPNGRVRGVAGVGHAATIARYRGELTA